MAEKETSTLATLGPLGHPKPRGGRAPPGISEALAEQGLRSLTPDVSDALPASFDPSFKSPCWLGNASEPGGPPRRHCLPFYFLLGNWQSGVRDLQSRLEHHPDVVKGANAAPHFWDERHPFDQYQRIFDHAVPFVEAAPERATVGDSSPSYFAFTWTASERLHDPWIKAVLKCRDDCQQKQPCIQDRCYKEASEAYPPLSGGGAKLTLPYYLRRVTGKNVRLVIMLRDPTERLHSSFWYYEHYQKRYGATEEGFAVYAAEMTGHFKSCLAKHSLRDCALTFESLGQEFEDVFFHCDQLIKSMYSQFMGDWLDAFPREDILVLRLEDYDDPPQRRAALERVFRHLMLSDPTEEQWHEILERPQARERRRKTDMLPDTRRLLREFYAPFNKELARQLRDPKFEWAEELPAEQRLQVEEVAVRRREARRSLATAAAAAGVEAERGAGAWAQQGGAAGAGGAVSGEGGGGAAARGLAASS